MRASQREQLIDAVLVEQCGAIRCAWRCELALRVRVSSTIVDETLHPTAHRERAFDRFDGAVRSIVATVREQPLARKPSSSLRCA
jgi:hypothetical protein